MRNLEEVYKTEEQQIKAVKHNFYSLKYIKNPSKLVQKKAILSNYSAIRFIKNPSEEIQEIAIIVNPNAIQYIKNPSNKIRLLAINRDPETIRFIKNPSKTLQMHAILGDKWPYSSTSCIKNLSEDILYKAIIQINDYKQIENIKRQLMREKELWDKISDETKLLLEMKTL